MALKRVDPTIRMLAFAVMVITLCLSSRTSFADQTRAASGDEVFEVQFAVGEWPPMVTETMSNYGKHSERVRQVFEAMGYRATFVFLPWQRSYELTRRGDYVATFSWLSNEERVEQFHVPKHLIAHAHQKGFYKKSRFPDGLDVDSFEDIIALGLRPVGVASYWYETEFAKRNIQAEITTNTESAWRFLHAERADILFEEEEVGWMDMASFLGEDVPEDYATTDPLTTNDMYILFSRSHPHGDRLQREFDAFMETDQGIALCRQWSICHADVVAAPDKEDDGRSTASGMN